MDKEEVVKESGAFGQDGLDSAYNQNMKRKMQDIQSSSRRIRDMNILVYQREHAYRMDKHDSKKKKLGTGKHREQLQQVQGTFEFVTGDYDGYIEICSQSFRLKSTHPHA